MRGARNRGRRATIRLSLSRATNKTTTSMRAPGLSLLAAVISVSFSDALSTLNGRVDEDHNAIVVEGGSTHASLLPIHDIEVSLCSRTCVSDKPQIGLLLSDVAAKIGSSIGESTWQSRFEKNCFLKKKQFSSVGLRRYSYLRGSGQLRMLGSWRGGDTDNQQREQS